MLNYINSQTPIEMNYPNGLLDEGRNDVSLKFFLSKEQAIEAHLSDAEVYFDHLSLIKI